jgi:SAM-dependent methyltransferase
MNYRTIVPDYEEYVKAQVVDFAGSEGEKEREGQMRFVREKFEGLDRSFEILELGCWVGSAMRELGLMGFENVVGLDIDPASVEKARANLPFDVFQGDMHRLPFDSETFDIVLCSHALEHAYWPTLAACEMRRVLRPVGRAFVVLPFPDPDHWNDRAHGGKYDIGTHDPAWGADAAMAFFDRVGFAIESMKLVYAREPEIWIDLHRVGP